MGCARCGASIKRFKRLATAEPLRMLTSTLNSLHTPVPCTHLNPPMHARATDPGREGAAGARRTRQPPCAQAPRRRRPSGRRCPVAPSAACCRYGGPRATAPQQPRVGVVRAGLTGPTPRVCIRSPDHPQASRQSSRPVSRISSCLYSPARGYEELERALGPGAAAAALASRALASLRAF